MTPRLRSQVIPTCRLGGHPRGYRVQRVPVSGGPQGRGEPAGKLDRLMKYAGLPFDKTVDVHAPALKKVLCGLLWEEVRRVRRVVLVWNGVPQRRPKADEIVLSFFDAEAAGKIPTWWNEAVLREAANRRCPLTRVRTPLPFPRIRSASSSACAGNRMPRPTKPPWCGPSPRSVEEDGLGDRMGLRPIHGGPGLQRTHRGV